MIFGRLAGQDYGIDLQLMLQLTSARSASSANSLSPKTIRSLSSSWSFYAHLALCGGPLVELLSEPGANEPEEPSRNA